MILTDHAKARWNERFKSFDIEAQFNKSKPATSAKAIREVLSRSADAARYMKKRRGLTARITDDGVLFVCSGKVIITVFKLGYMSVKQ